MDRVRILREKIASGRLVKGFFLTMSDPAVSEIAGFAGYDYVWIDAEHGALGRQEILRHIMAAQGAGCAAFVRVRAAEPSLMKAVLDMGPDGVIFPFCNDAQTARRAVCACSYPDDPHHGIRGQGPIRAIRYGLDDENLYLRHAYDTVLKIAQIETLEGYRNLDEILAVPGIDSLFIGAADLSRSMAGAGCASEFNKVYDTICRKVRAAGILLGAAISPTPEEAARAKRKGVQWVVFGQDARALAGALKANLDAITEF